MGGENQYIQLVKVLYCKLPTIGKQLPTFPHKVQHLSHRPHWWDANVLLLCHLGPKSMHKIWFLRQHLCKMVIFRINFVPGKIKSGIYYKIFSNFLKLKNIIPRHVLFFFLYKFSIYFSKNLICTHWKKT